MSGLFSCDKSCHIRQRYLQIVVFDNHMRLKKNFHWLVTQTVATQVAGGMFHYAMIENFVASLRDAFTQSRTDFYFSQRRRQEKPYFECLWQGVCYTGQFFVQLAS